MLTVAALVTLALSAASPFVTVWISSADFEWQLLSDVGQSFGLAATILSGAALIGVVFTVSLQRRQKVIMAEQATRQMQLEIMREAWERPELLQSLEVVPPGQEELAQRVAFLNVYFMYLRMGVNTHHIRLAEAEDLALPCFSTPTGAFYWERAAAHMRRPFEPGFVRALDSAYQLSRVRPEGVFLPEGEEPQESRQED